MPSGGICDQRAVDAIIRLGFVDAAIVTLAETLGLSRVATTDRRHFEPLAEAFSLELLP